MDIFHAVINGQTGHKQVEMNTIESFKNNDHGNLIVDENKQNESHENHC